MPSRYVERFLSDVMLSLLVHRHREPTAVWPQGGEAVADESLAALGADPSSAAAGIAADLSELIGDPVTAALPVLPTEGVAHGDLLLMPLRGSCEVRAGAGFGLRLRSGELAYVPSGLPYACVDPRGRCRLLVLQWGDVASRSPCEDRLV